MLNSALPDSLRRDIRWQLVVECLLIFHIFKHSGLLPETVTTALRQKVAVDFCIVLVKIYVKIGFGKYSHQSAQLLDVSNLI